MKRKRNLFELGEELIDEDEEILQRPEQRQRLGPILPLPSSSPPPSPPPSPPRNLPPRKRRRNEGLQTVKNIEEADDEYFYAKHRSLPVYKPPTVPQIPLPPGQKRGPGRPKYLPSNVVRPPRITAPQDKWLFMRSRLDFINEVLTSGDITNRTRTLLRLRKGWDLYRMTITPEQFYNNIAENIKILLRTYKKYEKQVNRGRNQSKKQLFNFNYPGLQKIVNDLTGEPERIRRRTAELISLLESEEEEEEEPEEEEEEEVNRRLLLQNDVENHAEGAPYFIIDDDEKSGDYDDRVRLDQIDEEEEKDDTITTYAYDVGYELKPEYDEIVWAPKEKSPSLAIGRLIQLPLQSGVYNPQRKNADHYSGIVLFTAHDMREEKRNIFPKFYIIGREKAIGLKPPVKGAFPVIAIDEQFVQYLILPKWRKSRLMTRIMDKSWEKEISYFKYAVTTRNHIISTEAGDYGFNNYIFLQLSNDEDTPINDVYSIIQLCNNITHFLVSRKADQITSLFNNLIITDDDDYSPQLKIKINYDNLSASPLNLDYYIHFTVPFKELIHLMNTSFSTEAKYVANNISLHKINTDTWWTVYYKIRNLIINSFKNAAEKLNRNTSGKIFTIEIDGEKQFKFSAKDNLKWGDIEFQFTKGPKIIEERRKHMRKRRYEVKYKKQKK